MSSVPSPLTQPAQQSNALRIATDGKKRPAAVSRRSTPIEHDRYLSPPFQGSQQLLSHIECALLHCLLSKPLRLISGSYYACGRCYFRQHIVFDQRVAPSWFFCCASDLTPAIFEMGVETMDGHNAIWSVVDAVRANDCCRRAYSTLVASAGASRSTLRPMCLLVIGRT